ncbi:MAG: DUF4440 domain-containing protein [Limnohabitans sp.]|jgi:ketosteroid isomerase-like protein|nr:DUF4440 domain-containing protein [Limnohabitans sp.]
MPKAKLRAATIGGTADDIEAAFYQALQQGDIEKLMACWADEDEVVCVHPGGPRLVGTGAIRAAFEAMFANGPIQAHAQSVRKIESLTSVVHNVVERVALQLPDGLKHASVVATNVYHRTPQGWRMVAHHASPGTPEALETAQDGPQVLH